MPVTAARVRRVDPAVNHAATAALFVLEGNHLSRIAENVFKEPA